MTDATAAAIRLPDVSAAWPDGPGTGVETDVETDVEERVETPWRVILFDDDVHTFDDVIEQLVKATGCTAERAARHAWTVHTEGKDVVYQGEFFDCFRAQGVLREIQLVTEIEG